MSNAHSPKDFFDYLSKPLERDIIVQTLKINKISINKIELVIDFIQSLCENVFTTYLGDDVINSDKIIRDHFNWCWAKSVDSLEQENLTLEFEKDFKDYMFVFFKEGFYISKDKPESELKIMIFWKACFNPWVNKTQSELDILVEVYNLFDKSLRLKS